MLFISQVFSSKNTLFYTALTSMIPLSKKSHFPFLHLIWRMCWYSIFFYSLCM